MSFYFSIILLHRRAIDDRRRRKKAIVVSVAILSRNTHIHLLVKHLRTALIRAIINRCRFNVIVILIISRIVNHLPILHSYIANLRTTGRVSLCQICWNIIIHIDAFFLIVNIKCRRIYICFLDGGFGNIIRIQHIIAWNTRAGFSINSHIAHTFFFSRWS